MKTLFVYFFGCFHSRTTFPMTLADRTYVACLDCGKQIPYDWNAMGGSNLKTSKLRQFAHAAGVVLGVIVILAVIAAMVEMPQ